MIVRSRHYVNLNPTYAIITAAHAVCPRMNPETHPHELKVESTT
jgi:hypothetical protein